MHVITAVNFTDPTAVGQAETEVVNAGIVAGVVCTIVFILLAVLGFIGCRWVVYIQQEIMLNVKLSMCDNTKYKIGSCRIVDLRY